MNKDSTIIFPQGGGGAWLSNLVYNLENNQGVVPDCQVDFDGLVRGSVKFSHRFIEHTPVGDQGPVKILVEDLENNIVFSNKFPFNHYLNDIRKLRYNLSRGSNIAKLEFQEQFNSCLNSAYYLTTDRLYRESYYDKIDLDHRLIFSNDSEFVDQLFSYLDQLTSYTPDHLYARASIQHYKSTCANPRDFIGCDNIVWLGWVAGVCQTLNIDIAGDLETLSSTEELALTLKPYVNAVLEYTLDNSFSW